VRLVHAVVAMRKPADIVNVNFGLDDLTLGAYRLNLIHQAVRRSTTVMHKRNLYRKGEFDPLSVRARDDASKSRETN
jgi:hypothetical protein